MGDKEDRILYGTSIKQPYELDDEDQDNVEIKASINYDIATFYNAFGTHEFKFVYLDLINKIRILPIKRQKLLCTDLIDKVEEIYDFVFFKIINIDNQKDCDDVYEFVSYLSFDYLPFISSVWKFLSIPVINLDIDLYCRANATVIISEIDDQLDIREQPQFFSIFLRTYNKDQLIDWFIRASNENRMTIHLNTKI